MLLKVLWTHMKGNIEGDAIELKSVKNVLITCTRVIDTSHIKREFPAMKIQKWYA
jgi:hypothetical protein